MLPPPRTPNEQVRRPAGLMKRPGVRWLLRGLAAAVALAVGIAVIGRRMPRLDEVVAALRSGDPRWLLLAAVLEVASIAGFGAQQWLLMGAMGVPIRLRRALSLAGAQAAIAMALPAGSAVATGFALRQLRRAGGRTDAAVTAVLLSGVSSTLGLLIPYAVTVSVSVSGHVGVSPTAAGVGAAMLACCAVAITWRLPGAIGRRLDRRADRREEPPKNGRIARTRRLFRDAFQAMRGIPSRTWYASVALSTVNWSADMLCLAVLGSAFHVHVNAWALAVGYLGVQVGRFVSVGSGGVGVVEPALLAVLVASGVPAAPAAAVVVAYRLLSCWFVILVGLPIAALLYQADRRSAAPVGATIPEQRDESVKTADVQH